MDPVDDVDVRLVVDAKSNCSCEAPEQELLRDILF
jgi:hypothetical protein